MIEIVEEFLDKYDLKKPENTFLVGFSGGCDSLSLLDMLHKLSQKYGFRLVALHLNHNWRGDESLRDEQNCKRFCERNSIEYVSETLEDTELKTETYARDARYDFFMRNAKKYPNSCLFTAHTRTDNAETVVYRIIKGTGILGLQGILPKRLIEDIPIYRPLLSVPRDEIEGYCISNGLVANNDSSNYDTNYKRNYIRHRIMPLFKDINFNAEKSIVSLARLANNQNKIVEEYMKQVKKDIYFERKILTEKFRKLSEEVMLKIIYDACIKLDLDYDYKKIVGILEFLKDNFGSKAGCCYSLASDLWVFASSKYIYLINQTHAEENEQETLINGEGDYNVLGTDFTFSIKKFVELPDFKYPAETAKFAYINLNEDDLSGLTVRTRRHGDVISPFGMTGSMKLKKYLNAKGVFRQDRDSLILLCKGSEVLWAVGVGLSNKLKVVNQPTHVVELK